MEGMIMAAQIILSLSILVAVHEFGHLLTAKYFGMRVEQFSIGFPPKLWSFKKGDTEYAISAIPLGGYVKISGMIDESLDTETMKQPPQDWEFRSKPAWQRLIVMLGGIIVNVIMGIVIYTCITYIYGDTFLPKEYVNANGGIYALELAEKIGLKTGDQIIKINGNDFKDFAEVINPDNLLTHEASYTILREGREMVIPIPGNFIESFNKKEAALTFVSMRPKAIIGEIEEGSLADKVGLKVDDKFISINGVPITYQDEAIQQVKSAGDTITFSIDRAGQVLTFNEYFKGKSAIGFRPRPLDKSIFSTVSYGFGESVVLGTGRAFGAIYLQLKAFRKIFSGQLDVRKSLSGPIGIATAFGGEWDWERFWSLTGLLSMVLAFMNLLPIPALDGGHVMFLSYEIISGRKPSDKFLETAQKIGMAFLLLLMVFIFGNDILKAIGM